MIAVNGDSLESAAMLRLKTLCDNSAHSGLVLEARQRQRRRRCDREILRDRELDANLGSLPPLAHDLDHPSQPLDDVLDDGEAEARAARLRREIRIEHTRQVNFVD